MSILRMTALVAAMFASQSVFATTYDFGVMGPPADKTITSYSSGDFTDYFTFTLLSTANSTGSAPDTQFWFFGTDVDSVSLYTASGTKIGSTDTSPSSFTFSNLIAGSYKLVVTGTGYVYPSYDVTLKTTSATATATAVPEPEAYAMMLAGLGLVGFAARRRLQA